MIEFASYCRFLACLDDPALEEPELYFEEYEEEPEQQGKQLSMLILPGPIVHNWKIIFVPT